jgi:hypothetical protein
MTTRQANPERAESFLPVPEQATLGCRSGTIEMRCTDVAGNDKPGKRHKNTLF